MSSPLEQFDIINIKSLYTSYIDLSLNNIFLPFMCMMMCMYMYMYMYKSNFILLYFGKIMEMIYNFLNNLVKQQIGSYGLFWFPFIFTLFNFILFSNLLSLVPFGMALTSHFMLMFWLSSTMCMSMFMMGLLKYNLKFLYMFMPQSPFILLPLLMPMEIFSYCMRLFSLAMSLAANLMAGHTLVHMMMNFFFNMMKVEFLMSLMLLMPLYLMLMLEFGVAFLQAYVFTVLFCIYLSDTAKMAFH